jgi:predicted nucleic acid-binding protein
MNNICVDTGFFIGLYNDSDQYHIQAEKHFKDYFAKTPNHLIVPFPITYETLNTVFVKNRKAMTLLESDWKRLQSEKRLELLPDTPFRDDIFNECFAELRKHPAGYRPLSLVDRVIRRILSDVNVRISALITFNPKDFSDVCTKFNRQMLS